MKGTNLGEFEEVVLLAVGILFDEAYGYAIKDEIHAKTGRLPSLGGIHSVLHRLEEKGFLESRLAGATTKRGGKRRRFFTLTGFGKKVLESKRSMRETMWQSIPEIVFNR